MDEYGSDGRKYPATSSYCFVANNPIKYFDLDGLQLWVANNEAMSLLLHTLAPEDRGYVVRDKNGFIDSKILTEGVKHSVSNSENLKSLQKLSLIQITLFDCMD